MAFKTMNRTIEEVERLTKALNVELERINLNTLSDSEAERLDVALTDSSDFHDSLMGEEDEEGEEDENL